ncbi:COMPASS (complex proteins associated with Set1p) component [Monosporozyma unispora]|nr:COMPASS (complex proteins associated with Set1p) component [Kazachstania unispora]
MDSTNHDNSTPPVNLPVKTEQNETNHLGDIVGGSYTRQYLNDKVTPTLLRGMRQIAIDKPANPLKALGETTCRNKETLEYM